MWFPFALFSAILLSFRRVSEKNLTKRFNHFTLGWLLQFTSLPFMVLIMVLKGQVLNPLSLSAHFWWPLLGTAIIFPMYTFTYYSALREGKLSEVLPIGSLLPAFSLITGYIFLGEKPSIAGLLGIFVIVTGIYTINLKGKTLHNPLTPFRENKSSLYMLLSTVTLAFGAIFNKLSIEASGAYFYSVANTVCATVILFLMASLYKKNNLADIKRSVKELSIMGSLQGVSYTAYMVALSVGPIAYVLAVRGSNVLVGALLGVFILKEGLLKNQVLAFALIVIGSVLLVV